MEKTLRTNKAEGEKLWADGSNFLVEGLKLLDEGDRLI